MRSLLLSPHPTTRNWDNESSETLEQNYFNDDQLFNTIMTAFMGPGMHARTRVSVCVCMCALSIHETSRQMGWFWTEII